METATASGQTVLLGISGQSGVLKSTAAAATAVAEALTDSSYDGVYLNITPSAENGNALAAFVQALRAAVPEKKLYVAASAPARREAIPDYQALGRPRTGSCCRCPDMRTRTALFPYMPWSLWRPSTTRSAL